MAKVVLSPSVTRQKGYVMTSRDLCWTLGPDGEAVFVPNGKRGRPAKVRAVCVRWTCGQAYTYSWNPALKREATEGMKQSQGQLKEAVAIAKTIWADPTQKASWQKRYKRLRGKYKSAWLMVVGECMSSLARQERMVAPDKSRQSRGVRKKDSSAQWRMKEGADATAESRIYVQEKWLRRLTEEVTTTLHVPIKMQKYRFRSGRNEIRKKTVFEVIEKGEKGVPEGDLAGEKGRRSAQQTPRKSRKGKKNISFLMRCACPLRKEKDGDDIS